MSPAKGLTTRLVPITMSRSPSLKSSGTLHGWRREGVAMFAGHSFHSWAAAGRLLSYCVHCIKLHLLQYDS